MEPGHEDREYVLTHRPGRKCTVASMEPGHEDREYKDVHYSPTANNASLNGARS